MGLRSSPDLDGPSAGASPPERTRKKRNVFSYVAMLPAGLLVLGLRGVLHRLLEDYCTIVDESEHLEFISLSSWTIHPIGPTLHL